MKETLELGPTPVDEDCALLGKDNQLTYSLQARAECQAFINQLVRLYNEKHGHPLPHGIRLRTKSSPHDYGTYYEVAVTYDDSVESAIDAAFWLEQNLPTNWDEEARQELASLTTKE